MFPQVRALNRKMLHVQPAEGAARDSPVQCQYCVMPQGRCALLCASLPSVASIEKRQDRYVVRWRVHGKARSRTFTTWRAAHDFKAGVEADLAAGKGIDPSAGRIKLREWAAQWQVSKVGLRPATLAKSDSLMRVHVLPEFGEHRLDRIRQQEIQTWVKNTSEKNLAPATVRETYSELSKCLKAAVAAKVLRESPCVSIRLPRINRESMMIIDHADIERLAAAIDPRYKALVYVLAYGGLRIGEALALKPSDIDLNKGTISVTRTATEVRGKLVEHPPKTNAGRRKVPLPQDVTDALAQHMRVYSKTHVFTTAQGKQIRANTFRARQFKRAVSESGLGGLRIHDLRHTAVSMWIREGFDLLRVKTWAGHTSATFTVDRYGQLYETDDAALLETLNASIVASRG